MLKKSCFFSLIFLFQAAFSNPFLIDFPVKDSLTEEDYAKVQQKLRSVDIASFIETRYPNPPPKKIFPPWASALATKEDFMGRISKATGQMLIDPEGKRKSIKQLIRIGSGGDRCLVSYASFNGKYIDLLESLPERLEQIGFNGYLLYRIGGFPNPTGKEIRYAAVPYVFKIFSMMEARNEGFSKVLWIDSAFLPLQNPEPLFRWIEKEGCFFKLHESFSKFILPKTVECLLEKTGVNVLQARYVSAQIFGLDFSRDYTRTFLDRYYEMVEAGFPFFSCFPEEYVFTALVGKEPALQKNQPFSLLSISEIRLKGKTETWARDQGYFFLQRNH